MHAGFFVSLNLLSPSGLEVVCAGFSTELVCPHGLY